MKKISLIIIAVVVIVGALLYFSRKPASQQETQNSNQNTTMDNNANSDIQITPISHATLTLGWNGKTILTDPVGDTSLYTAVSGPDVILITDIHGDHFSTSTLNSLTKENTKIISPKAVADQLPENLKAKNTVMANGQTINMDGFKIEAVPMYNVPESAGAFHTKGRGNGYVVEANGKRVYISGDTGNTAEMRSLQNIDIAFVCMNLPYTMSVEDAAAAVLAFKPKEVIPYHYRGQEGLSDTNKFKQLVNQGDPNINVNLLNFYPNPAQ